MAGELTDDERWVVGELLAQGWLPFAEIERRRLAAPPGRFLPSLAQALAPAQLDQLRRGLLARRSAPAAGSAPVATEEVERTVIMDLPGEVPTPGAQPPRPSPIPPPAPAVPVAAATLALPPPPVSTLAGATPADTVPRPRSPADEDSSSTQAALPPTPAAPGASFASAWRPGLRLGELVLREKLGQGAMGAVFLAVKDGTEERFAVKVLPAAEAGSQEVERFRREGLAMTSADDHPNVARVHAHGEAHGCHYLVLELLEGGDLDKRLERQGPLPLLEALKVAVQLSRGLAHAHTRGVLHRDLKPANVMFDAKGRAKLVDFGIARVAGQTSLTATGALLGSPAYMSPEQASGERRAIDERSDVYGLGAILYAALTGCLPHDGSSLPAVLTSVIKDPLVPPSRRRRGVSPAADELVLKAMAKEPDRRFQSARALTDALDALVSEVETSQERRRRRALLIPLAAAGALVVGGGGLALGVALARRGGGDPPPSATTAPAPSDAATTTTTPAPPARGGPGTDPKGQRGPRTLRAGVVLAPPVEGDRANLYRYSPPGRPGVTFLLRWIPPTPSAGFTLGARHPRFAGQPGLTEEVRLVHLRGFFLGLTEVTRGQWGALRKDGLAAEPCVDAELREAQPGPDHPATGVSWEAARDFCVAVGGRLPSEAEWEWAARGAEARVYPWGDELGPGRANLLKPATGLTPVGSFPRGRSHFGCDDLTGNACEWTADTYVPFTLLEAAGVREVCVTDDVLRAIPAEAYTRARIVDGARPVPGVHVHRGGDYTDVEDEGWTMARAHKDRAFGTSGFRLVLDE